ncbi:MAG TPA: hypothetical protein PKD98_17150 [Anaerolineae bacterium]|nr:hypothetical protein [Anaerolineae bacterium]
MKIALLANLKQNSPTWPGMPPDQWDNLNSWETIQAVTVALEKEGHRVVFLEGDSSLYNNLQAIRPDICFNLCEGHFGDARGAQVPAILEMLRLPYTGSRILTLALALDKPMTKRILSYHGLPVPAFQLFEREDEPIDPDLEFPLFVKPSRPLPEAEFKAGWLVTDEAQLRLQGALILARYNQPALVECYLEGREIMVGVVGNLVHPVARRLPEEATAARLFDGLCFLPPPDLPKNQLLDLNRLAAGAFRVMGCRDVALVSFKLDQTAGDKTYLWDIRPLPDLNPATSALCIQAQAAGWSYDYLINRLLEEAVKRQSQAHRLAAPAKRAEVKTMLV